MQNQKSFTKIDSLQTRKSSPEHSSPAEAEIRMAQAADAQILTRTQFYSRSWYLQATKTTAESEIIDENWFAADPQILTRTQFYGRSWNIQAT